MQRRSREQRVSRGSDTAAQERVREDRPSSQHRTVQPRARSKVADILLTPLLR
jgi:hypothetical protein